ncbi:unnamed protein product [Nezara viridula]|uniref:Transmembrane protein 65 n=1 Tax=Nezara viridula TaxID=85310 RepID=A0A9P0H8R6_NEZVI|nr:unnamed protein product [Nezara viridula]
MFVSSAVRLLTSSSFIPVKSVCELDLLRTNVVRTFHLSSYQFGIYDIDKKNVEKLADESGKSPPLDKDKARALILKLNEEERDLISSALKEYEANKRKEEYAEQLAALKWRSKFGRPTKVPTLGDVDPTGSYCPVPEDWLMKKYAETVPKPTTRQLGRVFVHNAIPFVGFGFLDNSIMILCGDYIEMKVGTMITISTMAAAALGNCFSDVLGLGSAYYVERLALALGFKAPNLTPIQLNMNSTRRAANLGRAVGVTIGCILGMAPLLIL